MQRRSRWALGALGTVAVAVAAAVAIFGVKLRWGPFAGTINALHVALDAPDAYLSTPSLSRLPRDLVKAPLARELLTEDFAFYYEEHEDRLGLAGALKRIAYEHDMTLADRLIELSLDEPAEVALWTDAKGAPRYWLIAMTRGLLGKTLQQLGPIAASDTQLSAIGELPGASGATPVYALQLSPRRTLAFVARGNRVVVLSDPGLLFDGEHKADKRSAKAVAALLSGDSGDQGLYRHRFGLGAPSADHVLVADSSLLSFGYRHFFPGLRALRVDVSQNGGALRTLLRVAPDALPAPAAARALWAGLPMGAAACSWLPADWTRAQAVLEGVGDAKPAGTDANVTPPRADADSSRATAKKEASDRQADAAKDESSDKSKDKPAGTSGASAPAPSAAAKAAWDRFVATLDGPAAVCWYARSQLHTPLLVARTRPDAPSAATDEALARVAAWLLPDGGIESPPDDKPGARRWQGEVPAPYGPNGGDEDSLYKPTLSHAGAWISFSPDDQLVELALAAQGRRYPSIADTLPAEVATLAVVAPKSLADLVQQEADAVLPAQQELFRQAAGTYLTPRLDTLRQWPAVRATPLGSPSADGWVLVDWQPLAASGDPAAVAPLPGCGPSRPPGRGNSDPAGRGTAEGRREHAVKRRDWLAATLATGVAVARAAGPVPPQHPALDREQSRRCRDWMALLIRAQIEHGPNPRWTHRDCAGLVRFAVDESLRSHDVAWKRANGFLGTRVPADVEVGESTLRALRQSWRRTDGTLGAFAPAIDIVQENTRFVSRDLNRAAAADVMFFDMGDEQHLMIWMGHYIAYHTGRAEPGDNGLRALRPAQLFAWKDTRWRPTSDNPNFAGIYCLDFLS